MTRGMRKRTESHEPNHNSQTQPSVVQPASCGKQSLPRVGQVGVGSHNLPSLCLICVCGPADAHKETAAHGYVPNSRISTKAISDFCYTQAAMGGQEFVHTYINSYLCPT